MTGSHPQSTIPTCVITVPDRHWRGEAKDLSSPFAARLFADHGIDASFLLVPDELGAIQEAIVSANKEGTHLVFTTGRAGLVPRDVTPEAIEVLLNARAHGLKDTTCWIGEGHAPAATLGRGLMGVTSRASGGVFVMNAPGSSGGVKDAIRVIGPPVAHILNQLAGGDHPRRGARAHRPTGAR